MEINYLNEGSETVTCNTFNTTYFSLGEMSLIRAVADPGFPVGGRRPVGGRQPPTRTLFSENICENERNGSRWGGGGRWQRPPGSANEELTKKVEIYHKNLEF